MVFSKLSKHPMIKDVYENYKIHINTKKLSYENKNKFSLNDKRIWKNIDKYLPEFEQQVSLKLPKLQPKTTSNIKLPKLKKKWYEWNIKRNKS